MSEQRVNAKKEDICGGWEEWWRTDRLDSIGWAAIFIWGGLVLLAESTKFAANFSWWNGWGVFFTGAGIIVLIEAAIRLLIPAFKKSVVWTMICGFVLLGIGLGDWFWAVVLCAVGIIIVLGAFARRR